MVSRPSWRRRFSFNDQIHLFSERYAENKALILLPCKPIFGEEGIAVCSASPLCWHHSITRVSGNLVHRSKGAETSGVLFGHVGFAHILHRRNVFVLSSFLDLLGYGDPAPGAVFDVCRAFLGQEQSDDVIFDGAAARVSRIRKENAYGGLRIRATLKIVVPFSPSMSNKTYATNSGFR